MKRGSANDITNDYIEFNICSINENGYDVVGKLAQNYFDHNDSMDDLVIRIGTSYDGVNYDIRNEIVLIENCEAVFSNDWWEGQGFIRVYGIRSVIDLDIYGGLYPD